MNERDEHKIIKFRLSDIKDKTDFLLKVEAYFDIHHEGAYGVNDGVHYWLVPVTPIIRDGYMKLTNGYEVHFVPVKQPISIVGIGNCLTDGKTDDGFFKDTPYFYFMIEDLHDL